MSSRPQPKESRTIPLYAQGDESGKLYRCWYCTQICNQERDLLGGKETTNGGTVEMFLEDPVLSLGSMAMLEGKMTAMKLMADGTAQPIDYVYWTNPEHSTGCPFCHSRNWRGDY